MHNLNSTVSNPETVDADLSTDTNSLLLLLSVRLTEGKG